MFLPPCARRALFAPFVVALMLAAAPLAAQNLDPAARSTPCASLFRSILQARPSPLETRLDALSYDPAHRRATPNSIAEAEVGLALENAGRLRGPIRRDPSGASEFIDANGTRWDVKAFRSHNPNGQRMSMTSAQEKIATELGRGEHLILDLRHLTDDDITLLQEYVRREGWEPRVIYYPPTPLTHH